MEVPPSSVSGAPLDLDYYYKLGMFDSMESMLEYFDDLDIDYSGIVIAKYNGETRSVAAIVPLSNPSNKHVEPVHNFRHENPAVVIWSAEERSIFMEKLAEYENEPVLNKYMKLALLLPGKSIWDIAMRCKWMEKQQTSEEHSAKRIKEDTKGKKVDISQRTNDLPRQWKAEAANATNDITALQRAMEQTLETSNEILDQLEANVGVDKFHQQQ